MRGHFQIDHARKVVNLDVWRIHPLALKVYGLAVAEKAVSAADLEVAKGFIEADVRPAVAAEGADNGLGFVIIHPGEGGLTIAAHWWSQGSVLCQRSYRRPWSEEQPIDTRARPVVACVWELEIINAEQKLWRSIMMTTSPKPDEYLGRRYASETV